MFSTTSVVLMELNIGIEAKKVVSREPAEVSWMRLNSGQGTLTNLLFIG